MRRVRSGRPARCLEEGARGQMSQVFKLQEAGQGPCRPTRKNSLLCSALLCIRRCGVQGGLRAAVAGLAGLFRGSRSQGRIVICSSKTEHVFSGAGCARTRAPESGFGGQTGQVCSSPEAGRRTADTRENSLLCCVLRRERGVARPVRAVGNLAPASPVCRVACGLTGGS